MTAKSIDKELVYLYTLASIGFGCLIGWDVTNLFGPAMSILAYGDEGYRLFLRTVGIASLALSYLAYRSAASWVIDNHRKLIVVAALLSSSVVFCSAAHQLIDVPVLVDIVAWVLFGAGDALLCLLWGSYLSTIPTQRTGTSMGVGAIIGTALFVAAASVSPTLMSLFVVLAVLAVSALVLALLSSQVPAEKYEQARNGAVPRLFLDPKASFSFAAHGVAYGFITFCMCLISEEAAVIVGASGFIGSLCVTAVNRLMPISRIDSGILQRLAFPIIVVSILALPLVDATGKIVCGCMANSALAFTNIITRSSACVDCAEFHLQPVAHFAQRQFPIWIGFFFGGIAVIALWGQFESNSAAASWFTLALVALIAVAFSIYGANDSDTKQQLEDIMTLSQNESGNLPFPAEDAQGALAADNDAIEPKGPSFQEACDSIGERYGLSPREKEVFLLLARGRNAKYIQEELCIGTSTVKTHIYRIYRKMGISSQQLLIDSVDEQLVSPAAATPQEARPS